MVAVPATKAFGKDRTGGAALLRGRGGAHLGFKDIWTMSLISGLKDMITTIAQVSMTEMIQLGNYIYM